MPDERTTHLGTDPLSVHRRTATHEFAHQMEFDARDAYGQAHWQARANKFLHDRARASGETAPTQLKKLYPLQEYRKDEVAFIDKWTKLSGNERVAGDYCGKVYGEYPTYWGGNDLNPTEIISMGVQRLVNDPIAFAKNDSEYFDFIIGLLHGK